MRSRRGTRALLASLAVLAGGALGASSASASYHLTKISEVHFGGAGSFVELQMYADGQNLVGGHYIRTYSPGGAPAQTFQIPSAVSNGQSQRTILIGNTTVTGADFNSPVIGFDSDGGAVCFLDSLGTPDVGQPDVGIDCLAWGDFDGTFNEGTPSPIGANVAPGGGLFDKSLTRLTNRGCPTALDAADDTDNSIGDFTLVSGAGTPRNNATAPTETVCTTPATNKKKKKCKKKKKKKSSSAESAKKKKCKKKKKK